MTSRDLATELEVAPRTILRDLDAMTEAGLPVIAFQGTGGGIELGFDYRTQMTALTTDEAEALALMLSYPHPALTALGRGIAAQRAAGKVMEAQADPVRATMAKARQMFQLHFSAADDADPRQQALARAVRGRNRVMLRARERDRLSVEPVGLAYAPDGWTLTTQMQGDIPQSEWGDIMISAKTF